MIKPHILLGPALLLLAAAIHGGEIVLPQSLSAPCRLASGETRSGTVDVSGNAFYRIQVARGDGDGGMSVVLRTEDGRWLFEYHGVAEGNDGALAVRICTPENGRRLEIRLKGAGNFDGVMAEKIDPASIRRSAPLGFYVNMDYFDEAYYADKLGLAEYGEKEIAAFFRHARERHVAGVFWRVSVHGQMAYRSKGAATVFPGPTPPEALDPGRRRVADMLAKMDPLEVAVREARRNNIRLYVWMTLSDEAIPHETVPDFCMSDFQRRNRHTMLLDRSGKPLPGTMCYNEPEALAYRLAVVRELLEYGADGLFLCTRSHSHQFARDTGDDYGFNPSVVSEYRRRYGKDILTEDFDVEKWRGLKGEGYDRLIRETSALARAAGQELWLGVAAATLANGTIQGNYGKTPFPWESNLREGRIDGIVGGQYMVTPYFASREHNRFRRAAQPGQRFLFWAQLYHYGQSRTFDADEVLEQARAFAFLGPTGALYHEALNLEQNPETLYAPLADFYRPGEHRGE